MAQRCGNGAKRGVPGGRRARAIPQGFGCIFFDPGRRDRQGRRIRHVEQYLPPLSLVRGWQADEIIVKLSPAVDLQQLASYGGQVEFISTKGQLTEALLWLHQPSSPPRATLLTDDGARHLTRDHPADIEIASPRAWLFEADPAVLRAGLVQDLAQELDAAMIDETIAYLTMDARVESPWGRYWQILDWMPFQLKRLRRYLIERGVGRVTVKKRGFAMTPDELIARLRLRDGDEVRVLVMSATGASPSLSSARPSNLGKVNKSSIIADRSYSLLHGKDPPNADASRRTATASLGYLGRGRSTH